MSTLENDRILQFRGDNLCDVEGAEIGSIEEIYLDADSGVPEWALVNTGFFGGKGTFVPLRDASETHGTLRVPYDKATVKEAPKLEPNGRLSQREAGELYRYYGIEYSESSTESELRDGETRRELAGQTPGKTDVDRDRASAVGDE